MYDARTLSGGQHMRLALNFGVAGLPIFLLAACASPFGMGGGWVYNPMTNTCERAAAGLSEDECRKNVMAAATTMAAATQQAQARIATATAASSATAFARSLPTNTPTETATSTPRPPTATATNTPLPTPTRTYTPLPTLAVTRTTTPNPTGTTQPTGTPQPAPTGSPQSGITLTANPAKGTVSTHFLFTLTGYPEHKTTQWVVKDPTGKEYKYDTPISWVAEDDEPKGKYQVTASADGRVIASTTFEVVEGERAAPRLVIKPEKAKRGTTFVLTFSGGQPNGQITWVVTQPSGEVNRLPLTLNASGNYLDIEYKASATHPIGVYRNEIIQQDKVVASATFAVTE